MTRHERPGAGGHRPFLFPASASLLYRSLLAALWVAVAISVVVWVLVDDHGWDAAIYAAAMRAVHAGLDPYQAATAIQIAVHSATGGTPLANPPYSYVYSPITLPLLRLLGHLPLAVTGALYWPLYALGALVPLWFWSHAATRREALAFAFFVPVSLFFPGLLANGIFLSGNVAFILYGAVLLAAWFGHRSGRWSLFYLAVLAASCVKAPLLSLVLFAPLQARRQWIPAALTTAAGLLLFLGQPVLWPSLFRNYLLAIDLQFRFNHDFGGSPVGLIVWPLYRFGVPYNPTALLLYAAYAIPLFAVLLHLSRHYLRGALSWQQCTPVLFTGIILLNPRIMEYDASPIALPLALIAWRSLRPHFATSRRAIVTLGLVFLLLNAAGLVDWNLRKALDGILLVVLFLLGALHLQRLIRNDLTRETLEAATTVLTA